MNAAPIAPTARKPSRAPAHGALATRGNLQSVPNAAPTPPLTRSLSSSPSSSALPEDYVTGLADDLKIVYATGLNPLDLDLDEVHSVALSPSKPLQSVCKKSLLAQPPAAASTSTFVPNPHAVHYLPTIVCKRNAADPHNCSLDSRPDWQPHRGWIRSAQSGAVSTYTGVQRSYATKVVDAGPWDTATISELAAKIVELAACGSEPDANVDTMKCVAHFALEISETFRKRLGEDSCKTFCQLLKQTLLSEYRAWWLSTLTSSVAHLHTDSPSPPHAHPQRLLTSALGIADFVGATFAEGLTSGSYIMLCLNILLQQLCVLEELRAIHCIIRHAGDQLYDHAHMDAYLAELKARVAGLADNASVVGERDVKKHAAVLYEDIERIVHEWAESRAAAQTSTEFSDTATEYSDYNPEFTIHRTGMLPEPEVPAVPPVPASDTVPAMARPTPASPPGLHTLHQDQAAFSRAYPPFPASRVPQAPPAQQRSLAASRR